MPTLAGRNAAFRREEGGFLLRALIFANGKLNNGRAVRAALIEAGDEALIIAADGGMRHALALGRRVDVVVGDLDSLGSAPAGVQVIQTPAEKDETDLELALCLAAERGATWIRVIGAAGGRLDQTLGNVMLLAMPALRGVDVRLVSGEQEAWMVGTHSVIAGQEGDTLSLLPLGGDVEGVRTEGLYYPLKGETLHFGPARGMSNVLTGRRAEVWVERGLLFAVYTPGRA